MAFATAASVPDPPPGLAAVEATTTSIAVHWEVSDVLMHDLVCRLANNTQKPHLRSLKQCQGAGHELLRATTIKGAEHHMRRTNDPVLRIDSCRNRRAMATPSAHTAWSETTASAATSVWSTTGLPACTKPTSWWCGASTLLFSSAADALLILFCVTFCGDPL